MNLRSIFCWFHLFLTRDTIIKENLDRKRDREHIEKKLGFFFVNRNVPSAKTPNDETMAESSELSPAKISCVHRDPHTRAREREREQNHHRSRKHYFSKNKKNGNQPGTEKNHPKKKARKSIWSLFSLVDFELFRCYNLHPFLFVSLGDGVICVSSFWLSMKNAAYVHWIHIFFCFKLFCRSRGRPDY